MGFKEYQYSRVQLCPIDKNITDIPARIETAADYNEALKLYGEYETFREHLFTMYNLAYFRYTINTHDEFYAAEVEYYDMNLPKHDELANAVNAALAACPWRKEFEKEISPVFFKNAELKAKAFSPDIMEELAQESRLQTAYQKLMAGARIPFDGRELTFPQLTPYKESPEREMRKAAFFAEGGFLEQHARELDGIYDELVKVRTRIAKKLGYDNFLPVGYARRTRNCYGPKEVAAFRRQVVKDIVPVNNELLRRQHERNGIKNPAAYDRTLICRHGNAAPKDTPEVIFEKGAHMYEAMGEKTGEFFRFMRDNQLFDVLSKDGKANGGYCEMLPDYKAPFVFANFNGTSGDIEVLTHECGHAFEGYLSARNYPHFAQRDITMDIAEIHSMSMEFFTYPYMKDFFMEDTDKFIYAHLSEALKFLPYGCMVDHFQEEVYLHPEMTPAQRREKWLELEKVYRPDIDWADIPHYGTGGWWQRQLHIYMDPFYYIDYCLAQSVALMFWDAAQKDRKGAWDKYMKLISYSGTLTFNDLLKAVGFRLPMEEGALSGLARSAMSFLDGIDTSKF